jgi:hypothetical protein
MSPGPGIRSYVLGGAERRGDQRNGFAGQQQQGSGQESFYVPIHVRCCHVYDGYMYASEI